MKQILIVLLISCLFINPSTSKLKFVFEIFRHGARGPLSDFNYYDSSQQEYMRGELTPTGQRQHYNLGQHLREIYKDFLPQVFNHSEIYVRSTDINRTLMSAQSQLQGLFPPGSGHLLPLNLTTNYTLPAFKGIKPQLHGEQNALPYQMQVIPIHTVSHDEDQMLQIWDHCPRYKELYDNFKIQRKDELNFINKEFNQTYEIISKKLGQRVENIDQMLDLASVFDCDKWNARALPDFSEEIWANITFLSSLAWNYQNSQPDLLRGMNSPLLLQIFDYMQPVVDRNNKNGLKWVMFSAHDTNIQLLSNAFNFTSIECIMNERYGEKKQFLNCQQYPAFAANIIMELHENDTNFELMIKRDGEYMNLCERKDLKCSYDEFKKRIYDNVIVNIDDVCGKENLQKISESRLMGSQEQQNNNVFYFIIGAQSVCIFGLISFLAKKRKISFENEKKLRSYSNLTEVINVK